MTYNSSTSNPILTAIGGIVVVLMLAFVLPIMLALVGAAVGFIVGWAFPATFATFFSSIGLGALAPWQIGAMLAFTGSFFRTIVRK